MNIEIIRQIMRIEGVSAKEAMEMWKEEVEIHGGDVFEACFQFGIEPDLLV